MQSNLNQISNSWTYFEEIWTISIIGNHWNAPDFKFRLINSSFKRTEIIENSNTL